MMPDANDYKNMSGQIVISLASMVQMKTRTCLCKLCLVWTPRASNSDTMRCKCLWYFSADVQSHNTNQTCQANTVNKQYTNRKSQPPIETSEFCTACNAQTKSILPRCPQTTQTNTRPCVSRRPCCPSGCPSFNEQLLPHRDVDDSDVLL